MTSVGEDIVILANALRDLALSNKPLCDQIEHQLQERVGSVASFAWQTFKDSPIMDPRPILPLIGKYFWKNRRILTRALDGGSLVDLPHEWMQAVFRLLTPPQKAQALIIVRKLTEKCVRLAEMCHWEDEEDDAWEQVK